MFIIIWLEPKWPSLKGQKETERMRARGFITGVFFPWKEIYYLARRKKCCWREAGQYCRDTAGRWGSSKTGGVCRGSGVGTEEQVMVSSNLGACLISLNYIQKSVIVVCDIESQPATLEASFVPLQENRGKMFWNERKGEMFPSENFQEEILFFFCQCEDITTWGSGAGQQHFPDEFVVDLMLAQRYI